MAGIRKETTNRLTLFRTCAVCGQNMITTADTPFMRQMPYGGKKQVTCYFCSESCKQASYKHKFDGKHEERRRQKELARDRTEYNRQYYQENKEKMRRERIENNQTVSAL